MTVDTQVAAIAAPGKYLGFILGNEDYGVEILKVQEINGLTETTRVPRTRTRRRHATSSCRYGTTTRS